MKKSLFLTLALSLTTLLSFTAANSDQGRRDQSAPVAQLQEVQSKSGNMLTRLRSLLAPVGVIVSEPAAEAPADTYREVKIRWDAYVGAPPLIDVDTERFPKGRTLAVTHRRKRKGTLPLQRSLELAPDRMLVVGVDATGRLRFWTVIADPRLLRAESVGPDNVLTGRLLHHTRPQFTVNLPDDQETKELRFYLPQWNGSDYVLEPVGAVNF